MRNKLMYGVMAELPVAMERRHQKETTTL